MIVFDETFKDLVSAPIKRTDVIVAKQLPDAYGYFDSNPTWTSSDSLMSVQIDSVGFFLGTVTKKAVVKLLGIIETATVNDLFQVRLGVYDEDSSVSGFSYISEGMYVIDSIAYDYDAGSTTITMYDKMWTAQQTLYYDASNIYTFTYPATVESLAGEMALFLGLDLMSDFSSLPNYDFVIATDLYEEISNCTIQTVIAEIAGVTGTTARISDNTLTFSKYQISDEVLTSDNLKSLKIGEKYGPVTSVILGRVPQNDNIVIVNTPPTANIISEIDVDTDLITVNGNAMANGSLIRIVSYGEYPEPLQPDVNYFVHTGGDANTFALATTYTDSMDGTNLIDITSIGSGGMTISNLATQEIQINNNQIIDNDRETLLPILYAALVGVEWSKVNADTTGIGYYEVGDVIKFTQGDISAYAFISEVHLNLSGSIKENIISVIPDAETINYQTAGGILKTIYNTEIKVDKQNQEIISVVSQVNELDDEVAANYSEIVQSISDITSSFQTTGGANLIKNSVGYDVDTGGIPTFWSLTGDGSCGANTSPESVSYGGLSGNQINIIGLSPVLTQRVSVVSGSNYSFGIRIKKLTTTGTATIRISNTIDDLTIFIDAGVTHLWTEFDITNFIPSSGYVDVSIECVDSEFSVTDLMLVANTLKAAWQQSSGEVLNSKVILNSEGIKVKSSLYEGDYTSITPLEFAGYTSISGTSEKTFYLNRDITFAKKLEAQDQIMMDPIKIVPMKTGSVQGWAFVKLGE